MLLLSNGTLFEKLAVKRFCRVIDSVFRAPDRLNDRKYQTLQKEINAL